MSIRNKIFFYFSLTTVFLAGLALFFIYTLFAEFREEEFQQRQKDKISTTLRLLAEIRQVEDNLIEAMDRLTIHDLYDEKLLIFDHNKNLIYSSLDDTPVTFSRQILDKLSPDNTWIETKDELYDVVGLCMESSEKIFYGISKAYDYPGYSKLNYLKVVLITFFIGISLIVFLVSLYLSKKITHPITDIAHRINNYDFDKESEPLTTDQSNYEITILVEQFNKLMKRMQDVFSFQKHAIHHISHELKTPIAILVSNFERIERETDTWTMKKLVKNQKEDTLNLSGIIDSLLEIAKVESGNAALEGSIRADELIFDIAQELGALHPSFQFSIEYDQAIEDENKYRVAANTRLFKSALLNLMLNSIHYSENDKAVIKISSGNGNLRLDFINTGKIISKTEEQYVFQHFFRGKNSAGKRGFGLGLVFVHKIITLHNGSVQYTNDSVSTNTFTISLPLS
ncbi:MAG: HAMP domain-containing histidine kinase [Cyclobacteriaceae bacterium]|nr:HAMP domain-containing histidine kinase [Cyclobacteriaceae bacterium]